VLTAVITTNSAIKFFSQGIAVTHLKFEG